MPLIRKKQCWKIKNFISNTRWGKKEKKNVIDDRSKISRNKWILIKASTDSTIIRKIIKEVNTFKIQLRYCKIIYI